MSQNQKQTECPSCGPVKASLSQHWTHNPSHRPTPSTKIMDILTGSMMGDGTFRRPARNGSVAVRVDNPTYAHHLDDELGVFSNGVSEQYVEKSDRWRYRVKSVAHPEFNTFDWSTQKESKRFDHTLELDRTIVKHWYAQDGGLNWHTDRGYAVASLWANNESDRLHWLCKLFNDLGFEPTYSSKNGSINFNKGQTQKLLDWMGRPTPGYKYKWEASSRKDYDIMKP